MTHEGTVTMKGYVCILTDHDHRPSRGGGVFGKREGEEKPLNNNELAP